MFGSVRFSVKFLFCVYLFYAYCWQREEESWPKLRYFTYIWKLVLKTWGKILAQLKLMAKLQWGRISHLGTEQKYLHPYKLRTETCFQQDIICYYLFHSSSKRSFVICSVSCFWEIRIKIIVNSISPTYEYRDQLINSY